MIPDRPESCRPVPHGAGRSTNRATGRWPRVRHRSREPHPTRRDDPEAGFGLIELLAALTILSIAILVIIGSINRTSRSVLVSKSRLDAAAAANTWLEQARSVPFDDLGTIDVPTNTTNSADPDSWVTTGSNPWFSTTLNGSSYEELLPAAPSGIPHKPFVALNSPVTVYQYVTWAQQTGLPSNSVKRITIVIRQNTPRAGSNPWETLTALISKPTTSPVTTTALTSGDTGPTTTPPAATCTGDTTPPTGTASVIAVRGRQATVAQAFTDTCPELYWAVSIDNGTTWGDLQRTASSPTQTVTLPAGDGPTNLVVKAVDGAGATTLLPAVTVTVDTTGPGAPSGLTGTITCPTGQRTTTLTWSAASGDVDGYRIYRQMNGATTWTAVGTTGAAVLTYADTTGRTNPNVRYQAVAFDAAGNESAGSATFTLNAKACN